MSLRVSVLTVSDRSAQGIRPDLAGPALVKACQEKNWSVVDTAIVPDEVPQIQAKLIQWCQSGQVDLIFTTGGTGFSPRDITPEATLGVIERQAPGLAEAMRLESLKITPYAMLSRSVCGIRGKTIIINLPGSPKAALENFLTVAPVLPHAVHLLQESPTSEAEHRNTPM